MEQILFSDWVKITTSTQFLIVSFIYFITPLIFYIIIGAVTHGKSSSGKATTKCMLAYGNTWIAPIIYTLVGGAIYLSIIVFPLWLKFFD